MERTGFLLLIWPLLPGCAKLNFVSNAGEDGYEIVSALFSASIKAPKSSKETNHACNVPTTRYRWRTHAMHPSENLSEAPPPPPLTPSLLERNAQNQMERNRKEKQNLSQKSTPRRKCQKGSKQDLSKQNINSEGGIKNCLNKQLKKLTNQPRRRLMPDGISPFLIQRPKPTLRWRYFLP